MASRRRTRSRKSKSRRTYRRKSPKRRSGSKKRKSPKRKSPKRKSPRKKAPSNRSYARKVAVGDCTTRTKDTCTWNPNCSWSDAAGCRALWGVKKGMQSKIVMGPMRPPTM